MDFRKFNISNLDIEKFTDFQKYVFSPLINESGFSSFLISEEEYLWKFKGAWKEGIIYLIEESDAIIASSTIVPYLIQDHHGNNFWCVQVFDNAVDKNYRKKNIFYKVYDKTYNNDYGYTCFGFPNENAIKTGLKFNGHIKDELFFWVKGKLNLPFKKANRNTVLSSIRDSSEIPDITPYIESLSVKKDKTYIKWRYFDRPNRSYHVYKVSVKNIEGFSLVVITSIKYKGKDIYLILDAIGSNEYYYRYALSLFISEVDKRGIFVALTNDHLQMREACFLKIPPLFAPKRHYLVYTERESTPSQIKSLTWHSSMGDWEVF